MNTDNDGTQVGIVRFLLSAMLFVIGLFFLLGGLLALVMVGQFLVRATLANRPINPLSARLVLAYLTMICSGLSWCFAAAYCMTKHTRRAVCAVIIAGLLWSSFFVVFPGQISM